jgi:hypothetical protein
MHYNRCVILFICKPTYQSKHQIHSTWPYTSNELKISQSTIQLTKNTIENKAIT